MIYYFLLKEIKKCTAFVCCLYWSVVVTVVQVALQSFRRLIVQYIFEVKVTAMAKNIYLFWVWNNVDLTKFMQIYKCHLIKDSLAEKWYRQHR